MNQILERIRQSKWEKLFTFCMAFGAFSFIPHLVCGFFKLAILDVVCVAGYWFGQYLQNEKPKIEIPEPKNLCPEPLMWMEKEAEYVFVGFEPSPDKPVTIYLAGQVTKSIKFHPN